MFGIEHFKHFTFGRKTHIITDHKPLLPLFQKSITYPTPRLSRFLLKASKFHVQLHYQPRSRMKLSDALSRQSRHNKDAGNHSKVKGLNISVHEIDVDVSECKLNNIHEKTQKDDTMQNLFKDIFRRLA